MEERQQVKGVWFKVSHMVSHDVSAGDVSASDVDGFGILQKINLARVGAATQVMQATAAGPALWLCNQL